MGTDNHDTPKPYKHGSMDITEQEKTFNLFMKLLQVSTVLTVATLVLLALFFA